MFLSDTPLSLQSLCRLSIRKSLGIFNLGKVDQLGLVAPFDDFVAFRKLFISAAGGQDIIDSHLLASIAKVSKVLHEVTSQPPIRGKYDQCPAQAILNGEITFVPSASSEWEAGAILPDEPHHPQEAQEAHGVPPPPPPPPPASLLRPGFWRFPGAEYSGKQCWKKPPGWQKPPEN